MSKSILVMDTPDRCWQCDVCASYQESAFSDRVYWCCAKDKDVDGNTKPDWCPLKPMPEKIDIPAWDDSIKAKNKNAEEVGMYMYDRGCCRGYNACIDEILGDD